MPHWMPINMRVSSLSYDLKVPATKKDIIKRSLPEYEETKPPVLMPPCARSTRLFRGMQHALVRRHAVLPSAPTLRASSVLTEFQVPRQLDLLFVSHQVGSDLELQGYMDTGPWLAGGGSLQPRAALCALHNIITRKHKEQQSWHDLELAHAGPVARAGCCLISSSAKNSLPIQKVWWLRIHAQICRINSHFLKMRVNFAELCIGGKLGLVRSGSSLTIQANLQTFLFNYCYSVLELYN